MNDLQKALVDKLRTVQALVTATGYTATNLSIAMANPDQTMLKPGLYVELDEVPLSGTDSSKLKVSEVSLYAVAKDRKVCVELTEIIRQQFFAVDGKEKKFDITDYAVLCIGSYWTAMQNPRWNKELDCFEGLILITIKWSPK